MKCSEITDPLFREAVTAIDSGDITVLENLLALHPYLVANRLTSPNEGYFKNPYLLWFVADNPIRIEKLPANILAITALLIDAVKREAASTAPEQLDYTLGLVATGRITKECRVQIDMIDVLIDAGARPSGGAGAIAHGNIDAAKRLIERGGELTLTTVVALELMDEIARMTALANPNEKLAALTAAAFYGNTGIITYLLNQDVTPNGYPQKESGFHQHATPLHQAVCSGSLEAVKLLVSAGADLTATDKIYGGTPLGWAIYMPSETNDDKAAKVRYDNIAAYLREKGTD